MTDKNGWMPIETAPKDGTEIIGCFSHDYGWQDKPTQYGPWTMRWCVNEWVSSWDGERVILRQDWSGTDYSDPEPYPTHWMPLPVLPSEE